MGNYLLITQKNSNNNLKNDDKISTKINENNLENHITGIIKPIPFNRLQKYLKKTGAICLIINTNDDNKINRTGTGFFCELKIKGQKIKGLFTNNHVLNQNDIQIGKKINFNIKDIEKDINIEKSIQITKERLTLTNIELDYTFIQIFNNEPYNNFFKIDKGINSENPFKEYESDDFCIIQYSNNELSYCEGKLKKIENNYLFYSIATDKGSSGSPLIVYSRNLNVIGIHYMGGEELNRGIYFKYILDDINTRINDMNFDNINKEINNKNLNNINKKINDMNLDNVNKTKINDENKDNQTINKEQLKNFKNKCKFITKNVTNMSNMFFGCSSLKSINLSNLDTNNVKDMSGMFSGCSSLTSLNLSNFDTNNVTNMNNMFYNCSSLTSINLNNFDANNVTNKIVDEIPKSCKINENDKN